MLLCARRKEKGQRRRRRRACAAVAKLGFRGCRGSFGVGIDGGGRGGAVLRRFGAAPKRRGAGAQCMCFVCVCEKERERETEPFAPSVRVSAIMRAAVCPGLAFFSRLGIQGGGGGGQHQREVDRACVQRGRPLACCWVIVHMRERDRESKESKRRRGKRAEQRASSSAAGGAPWRRACVCARTHMKVKQRARKAEQKGRRSEQRAQHEHDEDDDEEGVRLRV